MKKSIIKRYYEAIIQKSNPSIFDELRIEWTNIGEDINKLAFEVVLYGSELNGVNLVNGTK